MSNAVTVKQGQPSAPGEHVDTSAAKVVPASSEVRTEEANREVAKQGEAAQAKVAKLAKGMTGGKPAKAAGKAKAKPAKPAKRSATSGNTGNTHHRITDEWIGKDGKEVNVKDHVAHGEFVGTVKGRWTRKGNNKLTPMVTLVLDKPKDKTKPRHNAPAAEVTHVK